MTDVRVREPEPILLNNVLRYLECRGLPPMAGAVVTELTDGVSARVYLVEDSSGRRVVKQALPELNVKSLWLADPHRAMTEAAALKLAHGLTPDHVPALIDADPVDCVLTMSAAPAELVNWRSQLLQHTPPTSDLVFVGQELGRILGTWHRATWADLAVAEQFSDDETFEQLRLTPFHRTVLEKYPELQTALRSCIDELSDRRECLVHGDFSPKNILVSGSEVWVLDFEVARFGAAIFDLAFLGHHLAIKAAVLPDRAPDLQRAFKEFLGSYAKALGRTVDDRTLGWHIATLMLARVDGVSPAGYLSESQRVTVREAARAVLASSDSSTAALWNTVLAHAQVSAL